MKELAFVLFDEENIAGRQGVLLKSGFLKLYFGMALFRFINRKKFNGRIRAFSTEDGFDILMLGLPFSQSSLNGLNRNYLARYISRICSENCCARCFIPRAAKWKGSFPEYYTDTGTRLNVFKGLLIPVINGIYTRAGVRLEELDIAIICGDDLQELSILVKQLEPLVKYINVAATDKESAIAVLDEISSDSGMPIFTSSDFNSIIRNADLVINLGSPAFISRCRIRKQTLVINLNTSGSPILQGEFPIINGVEFIFPEEQYKVFGKDILRNYTKTELTEILMALKAGLTDKNEYSEVTAHKLLKIFSSDGCRITGFTGRRAVLLPEDVNKAIQL